MGKPPPLAVRLEKALPFRRGVGEERLMVKPRCPGHVEAPSATRRATDKWAHDTMRPEQLDSGSTHTSQPQEGCALLHPLQGVSLLSTPLQGGILKPPALRVVVDYQGTDIVRYGTTRC